MANQIQSLQDFVKSLSSATQSQSANAPASPDAKAFEEMRRFLINRYRNVESRHSFEMADGVIVDCVPVDQQPSLRGAKPATPPNMPPSAYQSGSPPDFAKDAKAGAPPQLDPNYKDRFGNQLSCPVGTIPVVRLTLEQLSRFRTLEDFFRKAPGGGRHPRDLGSNATEAEALHKYAHAFQNVINIGGTSFLNVWKPRIGANQIFSLSQHWYAAGSGSGLQTVECGWQVFPQLYSTDQPCLFIYWTRAGYAPNSGCYNLSCTAFVQTSSHAVLGAPLGFFSTLGAGTQYDVQMGFLLDGGNWWFSYNNQWLGYYPGSIFQGGALSTRAENIDYGGETVGTGTWPQMGSGAFPGGFGTAAYQRSVAFYQPGSMAVAQLNEDKPSPGCYRIDLLNNSGTSWGTHFFYGGPGGSGC